MSDPTEREAGASSGRCDAGDESHPEARRWREPPVPTPRHLVQPPEAGLLASRMARPSVDAPPSTGAAPPAGRPHRVAVVVSDTVFTMELGTIVDAFETANVCSGHPLYEVAVVAATPVVRGTGLTITADEPLSWADDADTVLVPGHSVLAEEGRNLSDDHLALVRRANERRARVGALCLGPYVLAAAGVLDGRSAVTHWNWTDDFAYRYPSSRVDANALFVRDGHVYTGAGAAMTLDLMLHLIAEDHGAKLTGVVARYLLSSPRRHGSYPQHTDAGGTWQEPPLQGTLLWATANVSMALTVEDLAQHAHMSVRSFHRYFRTHVGTTPTDWLVRLRVQRAQELLQTTSWPVDRIAHTSGFGSESTLRYHFARLVGCTPVRYRRSFALTEPPAAGGRALAGS
jgi:transcriptional regulator GlxA family with amidase domain